MKRLAHAVFVLPVVVACGTNDAAPAQKPVQDTTSFGSADGGGVDASAAPECAEETKNIFVIAEDTTLSSYNPPSNEFTRIGALACPTHGEKPTSMAVDRHGIAWVRYTDGSVWKVDTRTLSCEGTSYLPPRQADAFFQFGMGYSTSTAGGSNEELFLSDSSLGTGLAKLDTSSFAVTPVGPFTGALANKMCELTGTGDGKLYGFFTTSPAQIAEIAKGTGAILDPKPLPGVLAGDAWAFSFYGGDFYVYTSSGATGGSDVTRYRPSDASITVVKPKIGFKIVGAGVSTCAPTTGPR